MDQIFSVDVNHDCMLSYIVNAMEIISWGDLGGENNAINE